MWLGGLHLSVTIDVWFTFFLDRTGAGKSSLALTLLRIVEYSGTIVVDG